MIFYECVFDMLFPRVLKIICGKHANKIIQTFVSPLGKRKLRARPGGTQVGKISAGEP